MSVDYPCVNSFTLIGNNKLEFTQTFLWSEFELLSGVVKVYITSVISMWNFVYLKLFVLRHIKDERAIFIAL